MEENPTSKKKEYTELIHHFDKLENSYYEKSLESDKCINNLPLKTRYTGLQVGEVYDAKVNNNKIKLFVKTKNEKYTFNLNMCDEYNKNVEFIRFISYYDIDINSPSELIGKKVKIRKVSNTWELYVPKKITKYNTIKYHLDRYARFFGYHDLDSNRYPYEFATGIFVLFSVSVTFSTITYYLMQLITSYEISMSVYLLLIILFPFISSILYRINKF